MKTNNVGQPPHLTRYAEDDFIDYAKSHGYGDIHVKIDKDTGLTAIIAIHSTKLGPALGGCRCIEYVSTQDAFLDALRLARAMSYKAALLNLPLGGGKSVLIKPKQIGDRRAYFLSFGQFMNQLGGRYITAVDSGTTLHDMDIINEVCPYVASLSAQDGEPSPYTALGVCRGIEACVKHLMQRDDLKGLHVAVQGLGKVGFDVAKLLHERGAKLTVTDVNINVAQQAAQKFGANVVSSDEIFSIECDIFSPCALGAVVNDLTLSKLKCKIVAGSANNQLARTHHGQQMHENGILYAPDYVINAGGLIYAASRYLGIPIEDVCEKVDAIYDSLLKIFERSQAENISPSVIADTMAEERLA